MLAASLMLFNAALTWGKLLMIHFLRKRGLNSKKFADFNLNGPPFGKVWWNHELDNR